MTLTIPDAREGTRPKWNLSDRLRKAREDAGLDQIELSERAGVSRATISAAENGRRAPSRATIAMLAMATGASRAWLAGEDEPRNIDAERLEALMAVIVAARSVDARGHDEAGGVLDSVARREEMIQRAGAWSASSAINHPEVVAWCVKYRPTLAPRLAQALADAETRTAPAEAEAVTGLSQHSVRPKGLEPLTFWFGVSANVGPSCYGLAA